MQSLEIKAIEMEDTAFRYLDGFIHDHALYFLVGIIYLLLVLLAWILRNALLRKATKSRSHVQPVIFIHLPGTPPPPQDTFDPFPQPHHSAHDDYDDDWESPGDADWAACFLKAIPTAQRAQSSQTTAERGKA